MFRLYMSHIKTVNFLTWKYRRKITTVFMSLHSYHEGMPHLKIFYFFAFYVVVYLVQYHLFTNVYYGS